MPNSYGIVVEGTYDQAIYPRLIQKIRGEVLPIHARACGGIEDLKRSFPALLSNLEIAHHGNPVDKVLVIRDADGGDPAILEADLERRIQGRVFSFRHGVSFCAIRQHVETLLLADHEAINAVAEGRGVLHRRVSRLRQPLEMIPNAKDYLMDMFSQAGLRYTPQVCGEVIETADLACIRRLCPTIEDFIVKVTQRQR